MNHPNNPITWAQFEEFMRREFGPSDSIDYYTRKLNTIKQGSQETISEYLVYCKCKNTWVHVGPIFS